MKRATQAHAATHMLLPRTRLLDRVRSTPPGSLCLLASDAGYGRRTLLRDALGSVVVTVEPANQHLDSDDLRTLLTDALATTSDSGWLVVLGLAFPQHEGVAAALSAMVGRSLGEQRIAVSCTPDFALAFQAERVEGNLVDIDQEDLSLGQDESLLLLETWVPHLTSEERTEVAQLCDGWLRALVAVRKQHEDRPERDTLTWLRTYGAESLFGPWLEAQPTDVREMLLQTAILDRLTPELVDRVTQVDAGWTLPPLARPRGPLRVSARPAYDGRVWFDRHPLLTSLLRYRAGGRDGQARHRRAAEWYRDNNDLGQELEHRLLAGDAESAVARFHEIESDVLLSGRVDLALRWYEQLPVTQAGEHLLRVAWAHALSSRSAEARQSLYRLRALIDEQPPGGPPMHPGLVDLGAEADVLEAWIAERTGDIHATVAAADRARAIFGPSWATNAHQLATLLAARGRLLLGSVGEADRLLATVRENPFAAAVLGEGRRADTESEVAWAEGNVHQARVWASRHDRWLRTQKPERMHSRFTPSLTGFLCSAEQGEYDLALGGATRVVDTARDAGDTTGHVLALLAVAHLQRMRWRLSLAWEQSMLARAVVLEHSPDGGLLNLVTEAQVRVRLMAGDHVRAERLLKSLPASTTRQLLSARLALLRGTPHALTLVREIDPTTPRIEAERAVLSAWAHSTASRQQAEHDLLRVADLADQLGITSVLIDAPESLLEVARRASAYHVHDALEGMVRAAVDARVAVRGRPTQEPKSDLVLTRGELELLALLPTRATYGGMADKLGVSVNTVKTRLQRLYAKLEAPDRDTAIAQAARLGLLSRPRR